jgi:hypothetical protein
MILPCHDSVACHQPVKMENASKGNGRLTAARGG